MATAENMEDFDSGWQKDVWDFAIITTESNDTIYVMNGPIDYRYGLNYGVLVEEHFNCGGAFSSYTTRSEQNLIPFYLYTKERTKCIDVDVQYYWYLKGESWHFANDFYPHLMHVYKYKNTQNTQTKPQTVSKTKEIYEMALLMDTNRKYRKILSGPVIYQTQHKYVSFNVTQPYIKGDIHVLRKYGFCAKKVEACIFSENSQYGIEFDFDCLNKVELWQLHYDKKHKWDRYKDEQKEEKYDVVLVTNAQKVIKYVLYNVIINCIDEIIQFASFEAYESGDREHLEQLAVKVKGFGIQKYKLWLDNEHQTNFIVDTLYDTLRHTKFVFPDHMTPFKAFFYRFKSSQNKFEWKEYKNPTDARLSLDNLMHFRMDSNLQLIYNLSPKEHVQNKEVIAIDHVYENKEDEEYSEIKESLIDDATTDTTSNAPHYEEMIVNYSARKDYNKKSIAPGNIKQHTRKMYFEPGSSNEASGVEPRNKNRATKKSHTDTSDDIWNIYLAKYGFEPKNATQLMRFSKYWPDVSALKYVDARKCFNKHKKHKIR